MKVYHYNNKRKKTKNRYCNNWGQLNEIRWSVENQDECLQIKWFVQTIHHNSIKISKNQIKHDIKEW